MQLFLFLLPGNLALYPVNGLLIGKTCEGDPEAYYFYHRFAIRMNKISYVDSIFLGIYLYRLNP